MLFSLSHPLKKEAYVWSHLINLCRRCSYQLHLEVYSSVCLGCLRTWQLHHINITRVPLLGFWCNLGVATGIGRFIRGSWFGGISREDTRLGPFLMSCVNHIRSRVLGQFRSKVNFCCVAKYIARSVCEPRFCSSAGFRDVWYVFWPAVAGLFQSFFQKRFFFRKAGFQQLFGCFGPIKAIPVQNLSPLWVFLAISEELIFREVFLCASQNLEKNTLLWTINPKYKPT